MSSLGGKVALVTGSSRGIGAAITRRFAAEGARLALHGRDEHALSGICNELCAQGRMAAYFMGDVTKLEDLERIRRDVERQLGEVDILVANAGGSFSPPGPLEDVDEASWRASIDGNLTATFLTIKCFLPAMKRRASGNIITVSSSAARRPIHIPRFLTRRRRRESRC
ncbi:SDR family NAD(P)-dependent oxidoreductase [Ramlibacter sp.]|uniref:SDR family NAD(P)-dependent oxidoreductase n=1 Tax=Ramlibacter sp. TaxID=1917967 RepID=UPI0034393649